MPKDNKLDDLLEELKDNRVNLHDMLQDIVNFRNNLDVLLPGGKDKKFDFRDRHLLAERMKTVTEIIKGELAVRSQIDSSIKLETDMRNKISGEDELESHEKIQAYAKAIELLENKKNNELKIIKNEEPEKESKEA